MKSLIVRNIHPKKMDVTLGDLAYKIPYGQARDLFGKNARLSEKKIEQSLESGSLNTRIKQGVLLIVKSTLQPILPRITVADPDTIVFPQKTKSFIIIEPEEVKEELHEMIMAEDDEFLEELESEVEEIKTED